MEGIKLYVRNKKESKLAQKKAFELGLDWSQGESTKSIVNTDYSFLFFTLVGTLITHCRDDFNFFKEHEYKELSLSEWLEYEPLKSKKKKWGKLSNLALGGLYSQIKIKDPNIINQFTIYSLNGNRETLTIKCDINDIKVKQ